MILRHWQGEPVGDPYSVEQSDAPDRKPKGFWLSDERDETSWRRWCESEEVALKRLKEEDPPKRLECDAAYKAATERIKAATQEQAA